MLLSNLEVTFDVSPTQRLTIGRLSLEAFGGAGGMFRKLLGGKNKSELFMAKSLRRDRLIVVSMGGSVVGFAGFEYAGKGFIDIDARYAVRMLGLRGFLIYVVLGAVVLFDKSEQSEINILALAVSADKRGKGIGTKLLHAAIEYARANGISKLKLEVSGANPNAKRLYERVGFTESKVQKIPHPFSELVGFDRIIEMVYTL